MRGLPSDSAFIEVDRDGEPAGAWLLLEVTDTAPASPLVRLRSDYDAWRVAHPCPVPDAGVGPSGDDAGGCCASGGGSARGSAALIAVVGVAIARRRRRSLRRS